MKNENSNFVKNFIFFLDILLALLIIFLAKSLISNPLGRIVLIFGFVMLALTTLLKIVQKW